MDTNKKWIDDIRRQAGDYKRKAPEGLLDDIKKEMSRRGVMPSQMVSSPTEKEPKPNLKIVWGRRIAVAASVALAVVTIVKNIPHDESVNNIIADNDKPRTENSNSSKKEPNGITELIQNAVNNVKDNGEVLVAQITDGIHQAAGIDNVLVADNAYSSDLSDSPLLTSPSTDIQSNGTESPAATSQRKALSSKQQNAMPQNWYGSGEHNYSSNKSSYRSNFSLALNYTGMGSTTQGVDGMEMAYQNDSYFEEPSYNSTLSVLSKAPTDMTTHAHHDMPIKVGVNIRYNISSRWSLQTGVNYSYLSSDITRENNIEEYNSKQKLHYISVPLTASYSIWHNKNVNVYVSGGGEAAKLVKGRASVDHAVYGSQVSLTSTKEDVKEHRMQYSVNGAAGIEYKPTPSISVYAEPGVSHYFNNHSSVVNIYKDKPNQFTLNVGLRINLNK